MTGLSHKRRIGILGGMGPEATVLLMSRVIAMTAAADDSDHVPLLVDNNTQVPSRIKALIEKTGEDPGPVLVEMARRLEAAGVAALAMPCNTAHHYASRIQAAVSVPFLDMIELSAEAVRASRKSRGRRIGILASPAVRITGIFDRAFAARGLEAVYPTDQDALLACIRAVKTNGAHAEARSLLKTAALELHGELADALLVACSELSIVKDVIPSDLATVDTIDVLGGGRGEIRLLVRAAGRGWPRRARMSGGKCPREGQARTQAAGKAAHTPEEGTKRGRMANDENVPGVHHRRSDALRGCHDRGAGRGQGDHCDLRRSDAGPDGGP